MQKRRCFVAIGVIVVVLLSLFLYQHVDMKQLINYMKKLPLFYKMIAFTGAIALQIVFAFLPGEPLELAAGYMFGAWIGTLICLVGSMIGTLLVYFLVKIFKHRLIGVLFSKDKITEVMHFMSLRKSIYWFFIIFLIPGAPKDIMTYLASLKELPLYKWLLMTSLCRIPSIVTSTFLSVSIKNGEMNRALIIFLLTILIVAGGMLFYKRVLKEK